MPKEQEIGTGIFSVRLLPNKINLVLQERRNRSEIGELLASRIISVPPNLNHAQGWPACGFNPFEINSWFCLTPLPYLTKGESILTEFRIASRPPNPGLLTQHISVFSPCPKYLLTVVLDLKDQVQDYPSTYSYGSWTNLASLSHSFSFCKTMMPFVKAAIGSTENLSI